MEVVNQTRRAILQAISKKSGSASTIAKEVELSLPYTLSQLSILEAAGFIRKEKSKQKAHGKPQKKKLSILSFPHQNLKKSTIL